MQQIEMVIKIGLIQVLRVFMFTKKPLQSSALFHSFFSASFSVCFLLSPKYGIKLLIICFWTRICPTSMILICFVLLKGEVGWKRVACKWHFCFFTAFVFSILPCLESDARESNKLNIFGGTNNTKNLNQTSLNYHLLFQFFRVYLFCLFETNVSISH